MRIETVIVGQLVNRQSERRLHQHDAAQAEQRTPPRPAPAGHGDPERREQTHLERRQDGPCPLVVREPVPDMPGEPLQAAHRADDDGAEDGGRREGCDRAESDGDGHARRAVSAVRNAAIATRITATSVCENAWMATV